LLERAQTFYTRFLQEDPTNEGLLEKQGQAHFRLGHINRMLGDLTQASTDYRSAIGVFEPLVTGSPSVAGHKQQLATAYNWLGETLRQTPGQSAGAEAAYGKALELQQTLVQGASNPEYQQELARTRYNRGILYAVLYQDSDPPDPGLAKKAEDDFTEASRLLEGIAGRQANNKTSTQELGRVYNNLASLLSADDKRQAEARSLYGRAVSVQQGLSTSEPRNREYKYELATFLNNQAEFLRLSGDLVKAHESSSEAIDHFDDLVRQPSRLAIDRADALTVRGHILQDEGLLEEAVRDYQRALVVYEDLDRGGEATRLPIYYERFGGFLASLAAAQQTPSIDTRTLLKEAVSFYSGVGVRAVAAGAPEMGRLALSNLSRVMDQLNEPDRATIATAIANLEKALADGAPAR
jgi:tetratricopeptide (TPR) repeat protein